MADLNLNISDFVISPRAISVPCSVNSARARVEWEKPTADILKFNVDGSSLGKPGPAGIGGVLRKQFGFVLIKFSKSLGVTDSNEAEYFAIREALILFLTSKLMCDHSLVIESDSIIPVSWFNKLDFAPMEIEVYQ
ncbi:hypothetical protein PTKIN_Ptkin14bG0175000 [Pterospermum kingtungense]